MRHTVFKPNFINVNGQISNQRNSESDRFSPLSDKITRPVGNFRQELEHRLTTLDTDREIALLYSGGIDSEIIAESILDLGLNAQFHFIKIVDNGTLLNQYDFDHAAKYANRRGFKLHISQCNWQEFIKSDRLHEYIQQTHYACVYTAPIYCLHRDLWQAGLYPIMAANDPKTGLMQDQLYTDAIEVLSATRDRYLFNMGDARFFDSSELFLSHISDRTFLNAGGGRLGKKALYTHYYPNLEDRIKSIGFDNYDLQIFLKMFSDAMQNNSIYVTSQTARYNNNELIKYLKDDLVGELVPLGTFQTPPEPLLIHHS